MSRAICVFLLSIGLFGCDNHLNDNAINAVGKTPIRYIICGIISGGCYVVARFNDIDLCMAMKQRAGMVCDETDMPSRMVCTKENSPLSISYCSK